MDPYMEGSFDANNRQGYLPIFVSGISNKFLYTLGYVKQKIPCFRSCSDFDLNYSRLWNSLRMGKRSLIRKVEDPDSISLEGKNDSRQC